MGSIPINNKALCFIAPEKKSIGNAEEKGLTWNLNKKEVLQNDRIL